MTETLLTDRRDHVVERLSAGYANGAFEVEELERRLALAHSATTPSELDALVTDLVPVGAATSTALVPVQRTRVVFGSIERRGQWVVPQRLRARVLFGSLELDLREAQLAPGTTTIEVDITMGSVEIVAPPGVAVDVDASSFLGSVEDRVEHGTRASGASVVRVVGRVKLGSLEVETLRLGETRRDARWRHRHERRERRHWRRMQRHMAHRAHWRELRDSWD